MRQEKVLSTDIPTSSKCRGGNNLVNVILTDVRALDTVGEVAVLVVVAVGVLALAGRRGRPPRTAARSTDPTSPREREEVAP